MKLAVVALLWLMLACAWAQGPTDGATVGATDAATDAVTEAVTETTTNGKAKSRIYNKGVQLDVNKPQTSCQK